MSGSVDCPAFSGTLRCVRLDARAAVPMYHSELAAGLDLSACLPESASAGGGGGLVIGPGKIVVVPTGLAIAIPAGFEGQVRPRSGLSTRYGVTVVNAPGTIDADYRGELKVALINLGNEPFVVEHGMRVAQLVIAPVAHVRVLEVEGLDETGRGSGGFGSTGR